MVGLVIGVIFSASMGSTSGEINSLATVSIVDIYRRYVARDKSDGHYLVASRLLTVFWGCFAIAFAALGARGFGALIERVNIVGSLFMAASSVFSCSPSFANTSGARPRFGEYWRVK